MSCSADCDLNGDPAQFSYNAGIFVISDGFGVPQNGPVSYTSVWCVRVNMVNTGTTPHTLWPGDMIFENVDGRWSRRFSRDYTDGSASFTAWVRLFGPSYVSSVNSATGAVTIGLSASGS